MVSDLGLKQLALDIELGVRCHLSSIWSSGWLSTTYSQKTDMFQGRVVSHLGMSKAIFSCEVPGIACILS